MLNHVFAANGSDPLTSVSATLADFTLDPNLGTFDTAATDYEMYVYATSPQLGGFFDGGANYGLQLDNIQITAVPEPSCVFLGLASVGLMTLRRRRRNQI